MFAYNNALIFRFLLGLLFFAFSGSLFNGLEEYGRSEASRSPAVFDELRPDPVMNDDEPIDVVGFETPNVHS
jgi:hypothetical protein